MAENIIKQMPCDLNAEAAVLSAMMIDNYVLARAVEKLDEEHFYRESHKIIFRTIKELFDENIEIDLITLIDRLKQKKVLERVGGEVFIQELSDMVLSGANIDYHANIVLGKALLRQLIMSSNKIIEECYSFSQDEHEFSKQDSFLTVENIVDNAEQEIFKIAERPGAKTFVRVNEILPKTLKNIEDIATSKKSIVGIPSGFTDLDKILGGFRPGQFVVVAARPSMGKSSFALNVALNAAWDHDKKVGIFTMEMENEECLMRILSSATRKLGFDKAVSMDTMLKGHGMDEKKILTLTELAERLSEKSIYIDDSGANTMLDIRAKTRRLKAQIHGLDLVIIDYIQLMTSKGRKENRQQEIADISRSLKVLSKELDIPIMALSQLNRAVEGRNPPIPMLADLRESGAIEQDADIVIFIYRDEIYNKDTEEKDLARIIISKNRHGPLGDIKLKFFKETTTFDNYADFEI
ncbi:MAG: replicative DNA helicase [Candidatus Cloacimonetes bacterium]|nr:replicative DNA helicase [Candidatus Cloacimonadota bacterium]